MWYGADVSELEADLAAVIAWRDIVAVHAAVACALDRELEHHGLTATEFEVIERLCEYGDTVGCGIGLRVQELADSVHLSQSAVSRLIGRLERDGLVTRVLCAEDRRGVYVALTCEGHDRYVEAKPTHRRVLATTMKPLPAATPEPIPEPATEHIPEPSKV